MQASYDLLIGKGHALNLTGVGDSLLGGWTLNDIVYLSDGVTIASLVGTGSPDSNQRVNLNCNPAANAAHTTAQWFNDTCFSQPVSALLPTQHPRICRALVLMVLTSWTRRFTTHLPFVASAACASKLRHTT
jgi:hypothetical protein